MPARRIAVMSPRLRMYLYDMQRPERVETKRPIATRRKKNFKGRALWGLGVADSFDLDGTFAADWGDRLGDDCDLS